jgi:DNA-binding PadR family transcriptional regulator
MMKGFEAAQGAHHAKEFNMTRLAFWKVRILFYAAAKPVHHGGLLERFHNHGCSPDAATLNRILLRLERIGWLRSKGLPGGGRPAQRHYSLTPNAREILNLARGRLKQLVQVLLKPEKQSEPSHLCAHPR